MKMNRWIITVLVLAGPWASGQESEEVNDILDKEVLSTFAPIATDRPNITESAQITPVGWLQYEGGYQFSRMQESFGAQELRNRNQIEELIRFGISERFEVRAVVNANTEGITSLGIVGPLRRTGVEPVAVGFKYNLLEETSSLPHLTWMSKIRLPWLVAGDYVAQYQSNVVFHEQRLLLQKDLTRRLSVSSNLGISGGLMGSNGYISDGMFSFSTGYDLGRDFGVYLEYFSEFLVAGTRLYATPYVDFGCTKLLSNDLQIDVYAGRDLSAELGARLPTSGFFFGTGISYRFPLAAYLTSL